MTTACVSTRCHYLYDDDFSTCKTDTKFKFYWQYKAKLKSTTPSVLDQITTPPDSLLLLHDHFDPPQTDHLPPEFQHLWNQNTPPPPPPPKISVSDIIPPTPPDILISKPIQDIPPPLFFALVVHSTLYPVSMIHLYLP